MVNITFDTLAVGGDVTISGQIVYGTKFKDGRLNQHAQRVADGTLVVYDTGVSIVEGEIFINAVTYADGELLRTWLHDEAIFMLNPFTITTPAGVNLGKGKGTNIALSTFMDQDDRGVFKHVAPDMYKIKFPYSFVR